MSKYCGNCGYEMQDSAKVCGMCGTRFLEMQEIQKVSEKSDLMNKNAVKSIPDKKSDKKAIHNIQFFVSVLAILNVIFSPLYDVWGGLFPVSPDSNFWDVITGQCEPDEWVFVLTLVIGIPSFIMLVLSAAQKAKAAKVFGWIGVAGMAIMIFDYVNQFDFSDLFDFDDGNLCFGFWIGLILFIIMVCLPVKKAKVK